LKPILLLVLIAVSPPLQQQVPERKEPDLLVVKFSWAKQRQNSGLIRGAQRPGGPIATPQTDDRDMGSRKTILRSSEKKAASTLEVQGDTYLLRLEVKNTGPRVVRNLIWEFRPTAMSDDYEPKQYLCKLQVKPKDKKVLTLWTPFAPVKVIRVDVRMDALKDGEVVINKIEYADGAVWKRDDWYYSLPPDAPQKVNEGMCSVF
jgi:hypothetical protein